MRSRTLHEVVQTHQACAAATISTGYHFVCIIVLLFH